METKTSPTPPPSFGERMRIALEAFLRALLRLIAIVIVGALIGLGLFWGIPKLYNNYVQPLQRSVQQIEDQQAQQEQTNQQLLQQLVVLQQRIDALEARNDTAKQNIGEAESLMNQGLSTQQANLNNLESTQASASTSLKEIDAALNELDKKIADLSSTLDQTNSDVKAVDSRTTDIEQQLQAEDTPLAAMRNELQLVKAMELLTRSRMLIVQDNLGLAANDLSAARDLLAAMQVPVYQAEALKTIVDRLELALGNLPKSPVLAAEDLEIAWQLLRRGLPAEPTLAPPTETATPENLLTTENATPITPTPIPTATQAPTMTPTPKP